MYNFEFTVTGETRHTGTITQFGAHSAQIELAPYPMPFDDTPPVVDIAKPRAEVIELSQWRKNTPSGVLESKDQLLKAGKPLH